MTNQTQLKHHFARPTNDNAHINNTVTGILNPIVLSHLGLGQIVV